MGDLHKLLNDAANHIEQMLDENHDAREELYMLRHAGQEPNVFRVLALDTGLLIRFQDVPK